MYPQTLEELSTIDMEGVTLDWIALLVARERYAEINTDEYLARLDEFASRASLHVKNVQGGRQIIQALNHYLFREEGFRGNSQDYYHLSNSFLNDVLDRRTGIPITLSIVYIEIGRRLGLPLEGVNFPGHFLVRYSDALETFYIDPFHAGRILEEEDCRDLLKQMYGDQLPFHPSFIEPALKRQILLRMLINLKIIYMSRREFSTALQILNKMLLFDPLASDHIKERGIVYYQLECFTSALKDLETYLTSDPAASDRPLIESLIEELRGKVDEVQ